MKYFTETSRAIAKATMRGQIKQALHILQEHGYKVYSMDPCISSGNNKVGSTINFSLPAVFGCTHECYKTCAKAFLTNSSEIECYATKDYRYPSVTFSRFKNLYYAMKRQDDLKEYIIRTINNELVKRENKRCKNYHKPLFVRLHESGDFFSVPYLDMWVEIARAFPSVTFYTYSKAFSVLIHRVDNIPKNFKILLSAWDGLTIPDELKKRFHIAFVSEKAIPRSVECPATGSKSDDMTCEKCGYLCARDYNIRFNPH